MSLFVWSYQRAGVICVYGVRTGTTPASDRSHLSNSSRACEMKYAAAEPPSEFSVSSAFSTSSAPELRQIM